jgi:N-acetylglucosamine malate deacetylase 2
LTSADQILEDLAYRPSKLRAVPLLLVAAHPDDEMLGLGSRLPELRRLQIVFATDGAPRDMMDARRLSFGTREEYASTRTREAQAALALLNIQGDRIRHLEFIDQEATLHLDELAQRCLSLLDEYRPATVLTHAYEGGHPDHDAVALAVHLACRQRQTPILEFGGYHDPDGSGHIATDAFLPAPIPTMTLQLKPSEQVRKREALACYATQAPVLAMFCHDHERLRMAPSYDFTASPHPWRPYYESFVRGLDGHRWLGLARDALARAGVTGAI